MATQRNTKVAIGAILAISLAAILFLFWLIYVHPPTNPKWHQLGLLSALNALLNALSATALLIGYVQIRAGRKSAHKAAMITAFGFSTLFLIGYIAHFAISGEVKYPVGEAFRTAYLVLLSSHILLAIVTLPLVLITLYFAWVGKFQLHKAVAKWTFPLWLYVSVTGVITYAMLRLALG